MKLRLLSVLVVIVAALVATTGWGLAQAPVFDVEATIQPRPATLGEHVRLSVIVRHSPDLLITVGEPARVSNIELVATEPEAVVFDATGSEVTTTYTFIIQAFALGDLHPGIVEVSWLRPDGSSGSTTVRPPTLRISPVRGEGDTELHPLKPQATAGEAPAWWQHPEYGAGLVAAIVGIAALAWWVRRRRESAVAVPVPRAVNTSAEDRARARLDRLLGIPLTSRDAYDHYYGEISLITREYLAERFGFNATALTTIEFDGRAERSGIGRWQARLATGLLERCDAAVYARSRPDPASADHDLTVAYEVVELSRPRYHGAEHVEPSKAVSA